MDEFSERVRAAADARARQWPDARAGRERRRSIRRARALRVGGSAAVAAVVITGIGAAGVGFTGLGSAPEPSPSASPDLTIDQGDTAYATVPFPDAHVMESQWDHMTGFCGEPVPATDATGADFSVEFAVPQGLEIDQVTGASVGATEASATVSYHGTATMPAFVDGPFALYMRDGIVVGMALRYQNPVVTAFEQGRTSTYRWESMSGSLTCDQSAGFSTLEPGEYQMVLVTQVHNDETAAAMQSLRMDGFTLPMANELPAFREGAYECDGAYTWNDLIPVTCEPNALPGVEIDEQAGMVTVPYDASYYAEDVDLTFVSSPVDVTLSEREDDEYLPPPDRGPSYERGAVPACGDTYASIHSGSIRAGWQSSAWDADGWEDRWRTLDEVSVGDRVTPVFWLMDQGWITADLTVPTDPRVWVMSQRDVQYDDGDDDPTTETWESVQEVVAWLDTASEVEGSALEIVRYDGPETWPLTVTDVQTCDGTDVADIEISMGLIASPSTLTRSDGRTEELDALVIYP
ncbi:hypothetical protein [Demequina muriae]|uniref:Uncharacterized protein n=1 Tax=Demequina muriae TaxID=3051664 RepID=A0ABT8GGZ0_9MICO|nr:hypothetical protein [Demequina sp. EGI L300058]MDN4480211.1 hypothetical protein [Demequina sp. EGI L300058]